MDEEEREAEDEEQDEEEQEAAARPVEGDVTGGDGVAEGNGSRCGIHCHG